MEQLLIGNHLVERLASRAQSHRMDRAPEEEDLNSTSKPWKRQNGRSYFRFNSNFSCRTVERAPSAQ